MRKYDAIQRLKDVNLGYDHGQFISELDSVISSIEEELGEYYLSDARSEFNLYESSDDMLDEMVKRELEGGYGIERIFHFLGNWTPAWDYVRLNAYGNLEAADKSVFELYRDVIIVALDNYDNDGVWEE